MTTSLSVLPAAPYAVLAAGGTGGHVFPALAVGDELMQRGWTIALFSDARGQRYIDAQKYPVQRVPGGSPAAGSRARRFLNMAKLLAGVAVCGAAFLKHRPAVVVGFGGYPAFAPLLAAAALRIPVVLHEQNSVMGRTNRLLARLANRVAVTLPDTRHAPDGAVVTGNPVRAEMLPLFSRPYKADGSDGQFHLLITGGSQGTKMFSEQIPQAVALLPQDVRRRLHIIQQCRTEDLPAVQAMYDALPVAHTLKPFFTNMPELLSRAQLQIARAGASTLAEVMVSGCPTLFIPLPTAADDHQTVNAQFLSQRQAGFFLAQQDATAAVLSQRLNDLIGDAHTRTSASANARFLALPDAAKRVADLVESLSKRR